MLFCSNAYPGTIFVFEHLFSLILSNDHHLPIECKRAVMIRVTNIGTKFS